MEMIWLIVFGGVFIWCLLTLLILDRIRYESRTTNTLLKELKKSADGTQANTFAIWQQNAQRAEGMAPERNQ